MTKMFVSYSHKQGEWVWDRLVPCLKAGGVEVLIDRERFEAGKGVLGQMDSVQGQAEKHLLFLSPDYLASDYCTHEMKRAIADDSDFTKGTVIPVVIETCQLPDRIKRPNPLYVDLRTEAEDAWDLLQNACGIDLGVGAMHWLAVRDELRRDLKLDRSVNLVVSGTDVAWREIIDHLNGSSATAMITVDLYSAQTIERPELLACMLGQSVGSLPPIPRDLAGFQQTLEARPGPSRVALTHFDHVRHRDYRTDYFTTLRHLVTEKRKLTLLIQSRAPFTALLDADASSIMSQLAIKTVELKGRK